MVDAGTMRETATVVGGVMVTVEVVDAGTMLVVVVVEALVVAEVVVEAESRFPFEPCFTGCVDEFEWGVDGNFSLSELDTAALPGNEEALASVVVIVVIIVIVVVIFAAGLEDLVAT